MERNAELLNKAADRIEAVPESYRQSTAASFSDESPCGTVSCMAGEIIICSEPTEELGLKKLWRIVRGSSTNGVCDEARQLAGLLRAEIPAPIFGRDACAWPEPFRSQWYEYSNENKAKAAAGFLRYLAQGGAVEATD
ncbi:MAG: hypothetical protein AABN95_07970 [Acidobacteriota bacterium]